MKRLAPAFLFTLALCPAAHGRQSAAPPQARASASVAAPALESYFANDRRHATQIIEHAHQAEPGNAAITAYYAFLEPDRDAARAATATLTRTAPNSAFTLLAQAAVQGFGAERACERAVETQPDNSDVLVMATLMLTAYTQDGFSDALLKQFLAAQRARFAAASSAYTLLAEAEAVKEAAAFDHASDTAELTPIYSAAVKLAPDSPAVVIAAATEMRKTSVSEAFRFLQAHAAAAPDSYAIHEACWKTAYSMPDAAALRPQLLDDARRLTLRSRPTLPEYYSAVNALNDLDSDFAAAFRADLQRAYPGTELSDVIDVQIAMLDTPNTTVEQNSEDQIEALRALLHRPKPLAPAAQELATSQLVGLLQTQPEFDPPELLALLQNPPDFGWIGLIRLADRKYELPVLEGIALAQVENQFPNLRDLKKPFAEPGGFVDFWLSDRVAYWLDALGDVYLQEGKLDEAQHTLAIAEKLRSDDATTNIHLGEVYEARADFAKAENYYRSALDMHALYGEAPAVEALRRLYVHRHGGSNGLYTFMQPILAQETRLRRESVLAGQERSVRPMPKFSLVDLHGTQVSSTALRGKYLIVNFWATWCGPCRAEHPAFQAFYEKYKNDPHVAVISIATDDADTPDSVIQGYMEKHHYTFPVLRGAAFAQENHVFSIPLTWFAGPAGNIQFVKLGGTEALVQEFDWRLDAMRAATGNAHPAVQ